MIGTRDWLKIYMDADLGVSPVASVASCTGRTGRSVLDPFIRCEAPGIPGRRGRRDVGARPIAGVAVGRWRCVTGRCGPTARGRSRSYARANARPRGTRGRSDRGIRAALAGRPRGRRCGRPGARAVSSDSSRSPRSTGRLDVSRPLSCCTPRSDWQQRTALGGRVRTVSTDVLGRMGVLPWAGRFGGWPLPRPS